MKIRVSKEFNLEMAHALYGHDGPCKNIHGHSYKLTVCLIGEPSQDQNSKSGMVMDFADLKKVVNEKIIHLFDHALIINENYPFSIPQGEAFEKVYKFKFQPTCENILADFYQRLSTHSFEPAKLFSMTLRETATSFAEWYATDNFS